MSRPLLKSVVALLLCASLGACATGQNPGDPYEGFNRKVYSFNSALDRAVLRPVSEGYIKVTPTPVQTGVRNFFDNLANVVSLGNNILMLKPEAALNDLFRVTFNTVFGLGGLLDIATPMGLKSNKNGFGDTLAHYGYKNSNYLVLPLLPPSTVRDSVGFAADAVASPARYVFATAEERVAGTGVNLIDSRARLLPLEPAKEAALDEYSFVRDAYMAYRARQIGMPAPVAPSTDAAVDDELSIDQLVPPEGGGDPNQGNHHH